MMQLRYYTDLIQASATIGMQEKESIMTHEYKVEIDESVPQASWYHTVSLLIPNTNPRERYVRFI